MLSFFIKEGAFLSNRKSRDPEYEFAKYKQIDRIHVDGIAEWQVILLKITNCILL